MGMARDPSPWPASGDESSTTWWLANLLRDTVGHQEPEEPPGVNQGRKRGVTKSPRRRRKK